ncbi:hypothetical protein [Flavobacterium macacae]|uniref:Curlin n=1 Tax=Flavobacterium macacae TaxID=2488993 RepID=A0A3P3WCY8_9FLAO|nr:hypothetical protein [Flavobacterium macacae]RRJ93022.1 hypothetical protein EG849_05385 [Flavobacterium macacae]
MKSLFIKLVFITLFSQAIFAQEEGENPGFDQYSSSVFDSKENALNLVSKMNVNQSLNTLSNNPSGIMIQQIGDFNTVNASFKSSNVNFSVAQNGNNNLIEVSKEANSINQAIIQNGSNNTVSDFTYYTNYDVNMQMIQQGDNQNIQNYGTNSLSKDMKISQSGNGTGVIIINQ